MESTLDIYKQPYDSKYPVVCMDESSKQQTKEIRKAIQSKNGKPERYDSEYERNGVSNLFIFFEPLAGWRRIDIKDRRTSIDWALQIKKLVDQDYPDAEKITLVTDVTQ